MLSDDEIDVDGDGRHDRSTRRSTSAALPGRCAGPRDRARRAGARACHRATTTTGRTARRSPGCRAPQLGVDGVLRHRRRRRLGDRPAHRRTARRRRGHPLRRRVGHHRRRRADASSHCRHRSATPSRCWWPPAATTRRCCRAGVPSGRDATTVRWYVFDDRQVYRPGETVRVKGWVRRYTLSGDAELQRAATGDATVRLRRQRLVRQRARSRATATLGSLGGFDLDLALPDTANVGTRLELDRPRAVNPASTCSEPTTSSRSRSTAAPSSRSPLAPRARARSSARAPQTVAATGCLLRRWPAGRGARRLAGEHHAATYVRTSRVGRVHVRHLDRRGGSAKDRRATAATATRRSPATAAARSATPRSRSTTAPPTATGTHYLQMRLRGRRRSAARPAGHRHGARPPSPT